MAHSIVQRIEEPKLKSQSIAITGKVYRGKQQFQRKSPHGRRFQWIGQASMSDCVGREDDRTNREGCTERNIDSRRFALIKDLELSDLVNVEVVDLDDQKTVYRRCRFIVTGFWTKIGDVD